MAAFAVSQYVPVVIVIYGCADFWFIEGILVAYASRPCYGSYRAYPRQNDNRIMNNKISLFFAVIGVTLCLVPFIAQAAPIQYCFPVQPVGKAAFSQGGHSYPAIDIFGKRGSAFLAPVSGVVEDLRNTDEWDEKVNDPDKKGGRWVSLRGDDGFRYYGSHLERVSEKIRVGQRLRTGDVLGYIGNSGNAKGTPTHLHFGISYVSTPYGWQTRRGEVAPYHFLQCILRDGCNPRAMLPR